MRNGWPRGKYNECQMKLNASFTVKTVLPMTYKKPLPWLVQEYSLSHAILEVYLIVVQINMC